MREVPGPAQRLVLPLEDVCVFIDDIKQTTDVAKDLRFHIRRQSARKLYAELNLMDNDTFDSVAWDDIRSTLDRTPKMYQLWYGKQGSGYCGTDEMLHRWGQATTTEYPNCGKFEKASHLNMCLSPHRRKLLQRSISTLTDWIKDNYTHPEIIERFADLGIMSRSMRRIAHAADNIG